MFVDGDGTAEAGYFTVNLIDRDERTNRVFATVNPDPSANASANASAKTSAGAQNKETAS